MSNIELALSMLALLLVLMSIRIPIAIAMLGCGALGYTILAGLPTTLNYLSTVPYSKFSTYDLSVAF